MQEFLRGFLDYLYIEKNCSPKTLKSYGKDIEQFFAFSNVTEINEVTKVIVRDFLRDMTERNLASTTRRRKLASLRSFFHFLQEEGVIKKSPVEGIRFPKIEKNLPEILDIDEINTCINSISNKRDRAIFEILYGVGIRAEELVNIQIRDIDFVNSHIRIFGKGSKERSLPINSQSLSAINDYVESRKVDSVFLFPSNRNADKPLTTRAIQYIVSKYTNSKAHPHTMRHSLATHLNMNGVDIRQIQHLLGHSNINTTTIYTHIVDKHLSSSYHACHPRQ